MTTREYFQAVLDAHISDEMDEASRQLIEKLNARNAKRTSSDSKDKRETRARAEAVRNFFAANPNEVCTRDGIAEQLGLTPAQVSAACKTLVSLGVITKAEAKIGKSRRIVYTMPREE